MCLYYWIVAIGMCFIMKYGSILESFRERTSSWFSCLAKLYKCCLCMGFWAGVILIPFLIYKESWDWEVVTFPFSCACVCWYADSVINLVHVQTNYMSSSSSSLSSSSSSPAPSNPSK